MPHTGPVAVLAVLTTLFCAGCVDPAAPLQTPDTVAAALEEEHTTWVPFAGDGRSEGFVCLADVCYFAEASTDVDLPGEGDLRRLRANVTWTPRDPTIAELEVFLFTQGPDGEWRYSFEEGHYWRGTSPLVIESAPLEQNATAHFLHGRAVHRPIDGQRTGGGVSQGYHVEGAVERAPSGSHH